MPERREFANSNKGYLSPGSGNWFASRILCRETPDLSLVMLQLSLVILATGSITTQTRATKLKTKMSGGGLERRFDGTSQPFSCSWLSRRLKPSNSHSSLFKLTL